MAKILFVSKLYYPHIGGVEKHIEKLSNELQSRGHEVTVLTENYTGRLKSKEKIAGNLVVRFKYKQVKFFGLVNLWIEMLKRLPLFLSSDIIHIHDVFIWVIPLKIILFWKKIYLTNHGWEGVYPIPIKNIFFKRISTSLAYKSISVGKYIDKFYGISSDIVTYGAVDISKFKKFKKKNNVVYVGRLDKDTGLLVLLETLKYFKNFSVEFCGSGELADECKKYGKVHGFVNPTKYVSRSKICFCSGYLSILEAFSYKCIPVTAYDSPLKKSYFMDTPFSNYLICDSDPVSLVRKIKKSLKDSNKIEEAYDWVTTQDWFRMTSDYENLWSI